MDTPTLQLPTLQLPISDLLACGLILIVICLAFLRLLEAIANRRERCQLRAMSRYCTHCPWVGIVDRYATPNVRCPHCGHMARRKASCKLG